MEHPIITLFKPVLAAGNSEEAMAYMRQHPVLMSPYYTKLLQSFVDTLGESDRSKVLPAMNARAAAFAEIRAGKLKLPITSQILDLALKVFEGRYTLEFAQTLAAKPEFFVELLYPVITETCETAEHMVRQNWRPAVSILRILMGTLDARGKVITENQQAMELNAVETWLTVAGVTCADVPDGRIFRDAVSRGDALADIDDGGDPPANILHRLGVLHLDPYVAGRSSRDLDQQLRNWHTRLFEEYGDKLAGVTNEELNMPPIKEALPKAVGYFRRAAARRSGEARGKTLKAMAQAFVWHDVVEIPFDRAECVAVARESLSLLPPDRFRAEHAELNHIIEEFQEAASPSSHAQIARARELLDLPIEEWVRREGELSTRNIFSANAGAIGEENPGLAVRLLMAIDDLERSQPEARRRVHDEAILRFVCRAYKNLTPALDRTPLSPKIEALFETAQREGWPPQKAAYVLLSLAASTTATDQEGEGLEALEFCSDIVKRTGSDAVLDRMIPFLRAVLQTGAAVNAYNAGDFGQAAELYANALGGNLDANQPLGALDILRRILDLAAPGKPQADAALEALVAALASRSLELEFKGGDAAIALVQSAALQAMSVLMSGPAKPTVILFVLDFAKGHRFRAALAEPGAAMDWLNDPRTVRMEQEIGRLRSLAGSVGTGDKAVLDQNTLLTSYVTPSEMRGGATAAEQLRNLQIQFDTGLDRHLGSGQSDGWIPTLEKVQSLLDDKTVIMIQYIGRNLEGAFAIPILLVTADEVTAATALFPELPAATVLLSSGEETARANYLGLPVGNLRDQLVSPPGPRAADSRALDTLESDCGLYFGGPLKGKLDQFRAAGKNHLCIAPHGPLHFFPFHLLGPEDEPLAGDWCVTYLPHLRLLDREPLAEDGRVELTAVGVNFAVRNAFGLDPLEDSEHEASSIAWVFGPKARLLVGPDATEAEAVKALQESRRVHFSTHGLHNVSAPSFHCIFLNPDSNDDGILNAYELLRLDLRGLELVTFSACETALGRFDVSDNLRGIPAALLIAGVRTIVGTLWNVESDTSRHFFTTFYRLLKESGSTKKAFVEAQANTRNAFPKYRDWGAFQLIGAWT
jgi:hypothetical protein